MFRYLNSCLLCLTIGMHRVVTLKGYHVVYEQNRSSLYKWTFFLQLFMIQRSFTQNLLFIMALNIERVYWEFQLDSPFAYEIKLFQSDMVERSCDTKSLTIFSKKTNFIQRKIHQTHSNLNTHNERVCESESNFMGRRFSAIHPTTEDLNESQMRAWIEQFLEKFACRNNDDSVIPDDGQGMAFLQSGYFTRIRLKFDYQSESL